MNKMRLIQQLALMAFMTLALAVPAQAALVDIVVIGVWDAVNPDPNRNPYDFALGDKFVMKATYDDTSLFFRADAFSGVVASLDPTVNPGVSLDVIVPYPTPNGVVTPPLTFDESDHIYIGFAPTAEIMFDGPSVANPGNFRNFEIHTEYNYFNQNNSVNQFYHFDTFYGGVAPQTDIFNITEAGAKSATGSGSTHLSVVTNDMVANAGGGYVFNAATLSQALNGSFTGGNGFSALFDWIVASGLDLTNPNVSIADLGLTNTTDSTNIMLTTTELYTDFASAADSATASYANANPNVLTALGTGLMDGSIDFSATADDPDLIANTLVSGFESLGSVVFKYLGTPFLTGNGNVDLATLISIFGGPGDYIVHAEVTDLAGATDSLAFQVTVPEPSLAVLLLGSLALEGMRRRVAGARS
jgi:hypothetical protein